MFEQPKKDKPTSENLRDIINKAMDHGRRDEIQLKVLDNFFALLADELPYLVDETVQDLFNRVARFNQEDDKVTEVVRLLTLTPNPRNPQMNGYAPIIPIGLPIQTEFTRYSVRDVEELEGYKKLHTVAREKDIALSIQYLFGENKGMGPPPRLTINLTKSYVDGADDPDAHYPELPPIEVKFDRDTPKTFKL